MKLQFLEGFELHAIGALIIWAIGIWIGRESVQTVVAEQAERNGFVVDRVAQQVDRLESSIDELLYTPLVCEDLGLTETHEQFDELFKKLECQSKCST